MKVIKFRSIYPSLSFFLLLGGGFAHSAYAQQHQMGQTEVVDGKSFILHKIVAKETYYQLSRIYGVPVEEIMKANNRKSLRVGDVVRVPAKTDNVPAEVPNIPPSISQERTPASTGGDTASDVPTEYKVGKSETLFAISRRFDLSVEDIKKFNNLTSDSLREGQILRIPNAPLPQPEPIQPLETPVEAPSVGSVTVNTDAFKPNSRYGIRETSERGVGVWMENLETKNNTNLALHRTAPVGTVLKITNPINNSVTYAKVVGKFADNSETHDAIVVLSKSAASFVGAVDRRFLVEITYGLPLE